MDKLASLDNGTRARTRTTKSHIRSSVAARVGHAVNGLILSALGFVTLYPFWYCLIQSFNNGKDSLKGGIYFWPRVFTLGNYAKAFQNPLIVSAFGISVSRTAILVIGGCLLTALMAYALTKKTLPGRTGIIFYFYFTTIFSGGFIPTYIMYRQFGLLNNYWVLILPSIYSFFNALILRTFFNTIPDSLNESARIDGASEITIFFRIILPLSVPVIATVALFIGVGAWNDWFSGAYYLSRRRDLFPAATLLYDLMSQAVFETNPDIVGNTTRNEALLAGQSSATTPESLKMAFLIILTFPIMCIYPFLQKYFVTGIMVGSIKE
jgi:putative aldouronate transport system permease protein